MEPALVVVPTGVGSLLHAALIHYRSRASRPGTAVVSVEPEGAACVQASLAEGTPVTVDTGTTIMAGLNCGTPSSTAWPFIVHGLDAATTVSDTAATSAAHTLASYGVRRGVACGAASLAAARGSILTGRGTHRASTTPRTGPGHASSSCSSPKAHPRIRSRPRRPRRLARSGTVCAWPTSRSSPRLSVTGWSCVRPPADAQRLHALDVRPRGESPHGVGALR